MAETTNPEFVVYKVDGLRSDLSSALDKMRRKKHFCDVKIKIGDTEVTAHRNVLAAAIPLFYKEFLKSSTVNEKVYELTLNEEDADTIEKMIEFAYTGVVKIDEENMLQIQSAAKRLGLSALEKECGLFMIQRLNEKHLSQIRELAKSIGCLEIVQQSENQIKEATQIEPAQQLQSIENKSTPINDIKIAKPSTAIVSLKMVKKSENEIKEATKIVPVQQSLSIENKPTSIYDVTVAKPSVKPAVKEPSNNLIYLIGVDDGRIHRFDTASNKFWYTGQRFLKYQDHYVASDGKIYSFGDQRNRVEMYDTDKKIWKTWHPKRSQNHKYLRYIEFDEVSTAYFRDANSMFIYNPTTDIHGCVTYEVNVEKYGESFTVTKLLVPEDNEIMYTIAQIESYNVIHVLELSARSEFWCKRGPELVYGTNFGSAILNGKLYICGGECNGDILASVLAFDIESRSWQSCASMNVSRSGFEVVPYKDKLWAIGGQTMSTVGIPKIVNSIEIYNPQYNCWRVVRFECDGPVKAVIV